MILRVPEVATVDGGSANASASLTPTSNTDPIPQKLISDDFLNAEDSEDYIEETVSLYDEMINNKSGEHKLITIQHSRKIKQPSKHTKKSISFFSFTFLVQLKVCLSGRRVNSRVTNDYITRFAIQFPVNVNAKKTIQL